MARAKDKSDDVYNARRREYRAAQRYLKKANESSGATAERNRAIAKGHLENALATYDKTEKQKISAPIQSLANEFGIPISDIRGKYADVSEKRKSRIVRESVGSLDKMPDEVKRESEARAILHNKSVAKRVMGGLVDIWRDVVEKGKTAAENRAAAEKAILDYFGTNSWADVFDVLTDNMGDELFSSDSDYEIYDYVKIALQKHVMQNDWAA